MIISKIILNNCVYYHLLAEQSLTAAFSDGRNFGILEREITHSTLDKIIHDVGVNTSNYDALILNFEDVQAIQSNSISKISELKKNSKQFALINVHSKITKELGIENLFHPELNKKDESGQYQIFHIMEVVHKFSHSTKVIFEDSFLSLLTDKFIDDLDINQSFHSSSSIYLPKWINIKRFISKEKAHFTYSIYYLAIKTYHKWKELFDRNDSSKPTLVCQNLNSSYITSILSNLLKTDLLILDQIGPINKMYTTLDSKIEKNKNYIVVSDLVCLGTEVKIAKSLIEFLGGTYLGNISIIRIQTINPKHKDYNDTECVFVIDQLKNQKIGYQIKTDLH